MAAHPSHFGGVKLEKKVKYTIPSFLTTKMQNTNFARDIYIWTYTEIGVTTNGCIDNTILSALYLLRET